VKHKADLFEFEKVKELLFFQKNKFFQQHITQETKKNYLEKAEQDILYVQGLVKKM
jgi:hypothetical protein